MANINIEVAVFGAGIAGLTTAHELLDRGFTVTLFEQNRTFGGIAILLLLVLAWWYMSLPTTVTLSVGQTIHNKKIGKFDYDIKCYTATRPDDGYVGGIYDTDKKFPNGGYTRWGDGAEGKFIHMVMWKNGAMTYNVNEGNKKTGIVTCTNRQGR